MAQHGERMTLRQAALTAGISLLIMSLVTPFAEFLVFPKLIAPNDIEQTVRNIGAHRGLFLGGLLGYLISFICDVVVAWALYVLLAPVGKSLSLLAAWFRVVYAAMALSSLLKLVTAFRLSTAYDYAFGPQLLHAEVDLLLRSFRYEWATSLLVFEIHLALLGYLVYRSGFIPKVIGILLALNSLGWLVDSLKPYLYPGADLKFISITWLGEMVFMLWLLVKGWKIREPMPEMEAKK